MTAAVAIHAALPPSEAGAPSSAPSVESFARVLAGTQAEEIAQNTSPGGGDKAKQSAPADDEIANKELVACPGIVLPPNLIIVPSAPTPLPTPAPDLQTPVAVKQVPATERETPTQTRAAWVDSVPVQSSTTQQTPTLPLMPTPIEGQVAAVPELIGAQAENTLASTIPASSQPSRPHASPEVQEPVPTPAPALAKKVELPAEPQPESPQTPAPAEAAATGGIPAENLKEPFAPAVMSEANITLTAITTAGESSDTTVSSSREPAAKEESPSPVLPDSPGPSAALDRSRSSPFQDPPVQEVVAAAPISQPAQQQERGSKTRHRTDQRITGPPAEKTQTMRELHPSPSLASNGASVTRDVSVVENRSGPAQADPSVLINPVRTAREKDPRATLSASLKAAPDATSPEPLVLGTVHAAKLMERLGQSEMHVGLRTLVFPMIDLLLGGEGKSTAPARAMSDIEEQILEGVIRIVCRELQVSWQAIALEFSFDQRQDAEQAQHLMPPEEKTLSLSFEMHLLDTRGTLNLAIPAIASHALLRKIAAQWEYQKPRGLVESGTRLRTRLLRCPFQVDLNVTSIPVTVRDLLDLAPGKVLVTRRSVAGPPSLLVGEREMFSAAPARRGDIRAAHVQHLFESGGEEK